VTSTVFLQLELQAPIVYWQFEGGRQASVALSVAEQVSCCPSVYWQVPPFACGTVTSTIFLQLELQAPIVYWQFEGGRQASVELSVGEQVSCCPS
jgi:hypothetical protein